MLVGMLLWSFLLAASAYFSPVATTMEGHDAEIQQLFESPSFVNKTFCYHLNDKDWNIRMIYNPEKKTYYAERSYWELGNRKIYWSEKYGIVSEDAKAPALLLNHLYFLTKATVWEAYFKLDLRMIRGDRVSFKVGDILYLTHSYYIWTADLKPMPPSS